MSEMQERDRAKVEEILSRYFSKTPVHPILAGAIAFALAEARAEGAKAQQLQDIEACDGQEFAFQARYVIANSDLATDTDPQKEKR